MFRICTDPTERNPCSVQDFQLGLFYVKNWMSHSPHLRRSKRISCLFLSCPVECLFNHTAQHGCSLCLFSVNESVMNQSGVFEKSYIIFPQITSRFMMLAQLQMVASVSTSERQSFVYLRLLMQGGAHGKILALCLVGRELSCWWNRKWVMMKASFEVNLSWTMNTTGSQR